MPYRMLQVKRRSNIAYSTVKRSSTFLKLAGVGGGGGGGGGERLLNYNLVIHHSPQALKTQL